MKYIITENKLNNIILKYLDTKLDGIEQKKGKYLDFIFAFPNGGNGVLGWKKSGDLFINDELIMEISNFFGIKNDNTLWIISKWFEDKYNLKVMNTSRVKWWSRVLIENRGF
jgi:hypothetical protein